jgi:hypothetical protein
MMELASQLQSPLFEYMSFYTNGYRNLNANESTLVSRCTRMHTTQPTILPAKLLKLSSSNDRAITPHIYSPPTGTVSFLVHVKYHYSYKES